MQLLFVIVVEVKVLRDFDVEESSAGTSSNELVAQCLIPLAAHLCLSS